MGVNKPVRQVQFVVYEKFTCAYDTKLRERSCCYLLITYMKKKASQKVKTDKILKACALFVIYPCIITMHSCYDFALLHTC